MSTTPPIVDVAVVGAGLSGLQAARLLQQNGYGVIAGVWRRMDQRYDAVAHLALAKEFNLTPIVQAAGGKVVAEDLDGSCVFFEYGSVPAYPSPQDSKACIDLRDHVDLLTTEAGGALDDPAQRRMLDNMTFQAWVSALFILDYIRTSLGLMSIRGDLKHGGQHLRIRQGVSAFGEGLLERLEPGTVKLNSPVRAITTLPGDRVQLRTIGGKTFLARRVIVTVPSPVYRTIAFSPALPAAKTAYANATKLTGYIKYLPVFSKPFWRGHGFCGLGQSFVGPVCVFRDTSIDAADTPGPGSGDPGDRSHNFALTCFIAGRNARRFVAYSPEEKRRVVMQQISRMFNKGADVSDLLIEVLESRWSSERYNGWGCPIPTLGPGVYNTCFDAFVAPAGKLHFIGNETASYWRGYMEGALASAERGVAEVEKCLWERKASL
ncbi:putative flavin-containing monoamine oxidase A [Cyphellophora attinorum]|uniref:Amine oxidase n=1 Tax=Cyphellophora attinorum TaxID=1664694 RepID=A0A0N1HQ62_9EURO|nr:putative flavin-containing monoamine oxidase A [Phialophora attinorum]KPI40027.1 putative flavin-containing monoamine oxidase A [Phialophora attinorum]